MRKPTAKFPYMKFAVRYNSIEVDRVVKLNQFSNIANFKAGMAKRGLKSGVDYTAKQTQGYCYVRRLTDKPMGYF